MKRAVFPYFKMSFKGQRQRREGKKIEVADNTTDFHLKEQRCQLWGDFQGSGSGTTAAGIT